MLLLTAIFREDFDGILGRRPRYATSIPERVSLGITWMLCFYVAWFVVLYGTASLAGWRIAAESGQREGLRFISRSWDWLTTNSIDSVLPAAMIGAWFVPPWVYSYDRKPYFLNRSTALLTSGCMFVSTFATMVVHRDGSPLLIDEIALIMSVSFAFASVFGFVAYQVNRPATILLALAMRLRVAHPGLILPMFAIGLVVYGGTYYRLRMSGEIRFADRFYYYHGSGPDVEPHIEADSPAVEVLFWIPGELELIFFDPAVRELTADERG